MSSKLAFFAGKSELMLNNNFLYNSGLDFLNTNKLTRMHRQQGNA